jgi:hypothetical protein
MKFPETKLQLNVDVFLIMIFFTMLICSCCCWRKSVRESFSAALTTVYKGPGLVMAGAYNKLNHIPPETMTSSDITM